MSDTKSSDSGAQDDRFCSTSLTQADFLKRLVEKHDYDPLPKTRLAIVSQAKQWIVDGVTLEEVDHAVDQSRKQLLANNDEKDPPIAYLAKVVAGNRSQSVPVPAPSKHGGFAERGYANDPGLSRFNVSGKGI